MSSGSQKRKAHQQIKINCTPEQKARLVEIAERHGQSPAALCLKALLGLPLPRQRRARVTDKIMAKFQPAAADVAGAIREAKSAVKDAGVNVNQLTHYAHMDRVMAASITVALEHLNQTLARLDEAAADVNELRTIIMQEGGYERGGPG